MLAWNYLLNLTKADNNDIRQQNMAEKIHITSHPYMYITQNHHMYFFHMRSRVSLVLACPHFSRASFFFFSSHTSTGGLQSPISFLFSLCLLLSYSFLCSLSWHRLRLPSPLPYVHTLFNNLRSENAIIECLSIQLDHRDMLFLPISFAPFRRLNNVCVSSTSTLLDAGGADGSHQYAKYVIRMTPSTDRLQISDEFHHRILAEKMR